MVFGTGGEDFFPEVGQRPLVSDKPRMTHLKIIMMKSRHERFVVHVKLFFFLN